MTGESFNSVRAAAEMCFGLRCPISSHARQNTASGSPQDLAVLYVIQFTYAVYPMRGSFRATKQPVAFLPLAHCRPPPRKYTIEQQSAPTQPPCAQVVLLISCVRNLWTTLTRNGPLLPGQQQAFTPVAFFPQLPDSSCVGDGIGSTDPTLSS